MMRRIDSQFHKVQREALLQEECKGVDDPAKLSKFRSQAAQMKRLEEKLVDAEDLNDLYIENSFELQSQLSEREAEIHNLKQEVQILTHKSEVASAKLESLEEAHSQCWAKRTEMATMRARIQQLEDESSNQNLQTEEVKQLHMQQVKELHETQQQQKEELDKLRTENEALRAVKEDSEPTYTHKRDPESHQAARRPIDFTERQILTEGVAHKILNDLRQELHIVTQEKEDLVQQIRAAASSGHISLPQTCIYPSTEAYRKLIEHTEPLKSVMQHYQAYKAIDLLISNLPMLKRGITLNQEQFKDLWNRANSRAKDTLTFMWAVGDLKLSLGIIEIVTGSPPFYICRGISTSESEKSSR